MSDGGLRSSASMKLRATFFISENLGMSLFFSLVEVSILLLGSSGIGFELAKQGGDSFKVALQFGSFIGLDHFLHEITIVLETNAKFLKDNFFTTLCIAGFFLIRGTTLLIQ